MESEDLTQAGALERRFNTHKVESRGCINDMAAVRAMCAAISKTIYESTGECREGYLAQTKLEEVMFWANAGISRKNGKPAGYGFAVEEKYK